ncbi:DNA primase [Geitlerinema sp. PCC 9228]|uniref:DNA primase n=1 Tax=Geitlerinema sp. PCC 9228 TaxID=111611 RepID=UPI0008F9C4A4|nr:DNA primase [Geitlerinema sp. PCC 9228]
MSSSNVPRLHPDTIEAVNQHADIVDIVSEHVVLRKQGKDYAGLCPFHEEKTPSFTVSPSKQMFYCFGCGMGGNAVKFLMETTKQSFAEVVLDLAQRYQVPIKTLDPEQRQEIQRQLSQQEKYYEIMAIAASFFQHALYQPQGKAALDYLQNNRQLSETTIQKFQLGYAPAGWETLYRYLVEQKRFPVEWVEEMGLIAQRKSGNGYYDRFRDRLMIPICDVKGRVIAFGGRTLKDEEPKYLNSPETSLFQKGNTLFALDKARGAISKQDRAVVVEGYFDAIALHAASIENVVACLGTALSQNQLYQLLRYTESKQVIFNFDADRSGTTAAQRAIGQIAHLAYQGDVQLRVLTMPDGKDADEFLKSHQSAEPYRQLLDEAPLWVDWQIQQIVADKDLNQADDFQTASNELVKLLQKITNSNARTHYISQCAELLSQGDTRLVPLYADNLRRQLRFPRQKSSSKSADTADTSTLGDWKFLERAEALLLRLYIHCPQARATVLEALQHLDEQGADFSLSHHRFLWQQILSLSEENHDSDTIVEKLQTQCMEFPDKMEQVAHLFYLDENHEIEMQRIPLVVRAASAYIERAMCQKRRRYLLERWQQAIASANHDEAAWVQEQIYTETRRLQELDQQRRVHFDDLLQFS